MELSRQRLATARLRLRPWQRADLDAMAGWPPFTEPLDRVWNWPRRLQAEGSLDLFFFSRSSDPAFAAWTIVLSDAIVGLLQLKQIRREERDAELGIAFGAPWAGQGLGRETLDAFLEVYFGTAGFRTLMLEVAAANSRAQRLYARLHFAETSRFWRYAGPAHEYGFLDQPEYAAVRPYFRHTGSGVYQMYIGMRLDAAGWREHRAAAG
jgi:RimJ/RimL family protein N-acetyltransferase